MTIALHTCCGPCLIEPFDAFVAEDDVVVVYANPNIDPEVEYARRRDAMIEYATIVGARAVEMPYDPYAWRAAVAGVEDNQPLRCAICYRLRLGMTARWAAEQGIERFATTLTVSPYQEPESIRRAGEEVSSATGVSYVHRDFRDRYPSATARARDIGLYRQNYCGCAYSRCEAEAARQKRRTDREAARAGRNVAKEREASGRERAIDV